MKKIIIYAFILSLIITSCGTHTAQGAYTGSQVGSVLGSAIGGLANGWRGRDVGTIAGMVGGAVVGGAIGNSIDKAKDKKQDKRRDDVYDYEEYERREKYNDRRHYNNDVSFASSKSANSVRLQNIIFYDEDDNGILSAGERAEVVFEVYNTTGRTLFDVVPMLEQVSDMKHIQISKPQVIERLEAGRAIKYTAYIKTSNKLKNGFAEFRISVRNTSDKLLAPVTQFEVETMR